MRVVIHIVFWFYSSSVLGQGSNTILFSSCGDTLLTRTSCYCETEDTLTTYFTVLENMEGNLRLISVFKVKEPGKNSIPCADFKHVHPDTISKYSLNNEGLLGVSPDNYDIVSTINQTDKLKNDRGKRVFFRLVKHEFRIDHETFFTITVGDIAKKKRQRVETPRISKIFGLKKLNKYHFEVIIEDSNIDRGTGKVTKSVRHTKIVN